MNRNRPQALIRISTHCHLTRTLDKRCCRNRPQALSRISTTRNHARLAVRRPQVAIARRLLEEFQQSKAALKEIWRVGYNKKFPDELVYLSRNGVISIFRGNIVYTQFMPPNPKKYFNDNIVFGSQITVAKWKLFERFFIAGRFIQ